MAPANPIFDWGHRNGPLSPNANNPPPGADPQTQTIGQALGNQATGGVSSLLPSGFFGGALWLRVAEVIIGGALVLVGIGAMIRKPVTAAAAPVVKTAAKVIK